jgi:hypothetical protein
MMNWFQSFDFAEFLMWYGGLTLVLNTYDAVRILIDKRSWK